MSFRPHRSLLTLTATLCFGAGLYVAAQSAPDTSRAKTVDNGLGAIDLDTTMDPEQYGVTRRRGFVSRERSSLPYEPGKVIVKFREAGGRPDREALMRALADVGASEMSQPSHADFEVIRIDPAADPEAVAARLMERPDVVHAQAAYRVYSSFRPNDPQFTNQWNLSALGMETAWDIQPGSSSSIIVAVLDTGVAFENTTFDFTATAFVDDNGVRYPALGRVSVPFAAAPDLASANRFVTPRDFIYDDTDPVDLDGHGTHVSGTIGQLTNNSTGVAGMAYNVRLMPVKCISSTWDDIFDSPYVGTDDIVARAIRYAADNGAKVINMSLGRNGGPAAPLIGEALRYAVGKGTFIAVAGGNDYEDGNPTERLAEQAGPIEGAMVVASVGRDMTRAYYSGVKSYIDIAAPGGNRRSGGAEGMILQQTYSPSATDTFLLPPSQFRAPRFDTMALVYYQGTSMATPHVAGMAALLMSQGITSPAAVEAAIKRFATEAGAAGRDDEYGSGIINPRATLRGLGLAK